MHERAAHRTRVGTREARGTRRGKGNRKSGAEEILTGVTVAALSSLRPRATLINKKSLNFPRRAERKSGHHVASWDRCSLFVLPTSGLSFFPVSTRRLQRAILADPR